MGNEAEAIEEEVTTDFEDEFNKQAAEKDSVKTVDETESELDDIEKEKSEEVSEGDEVDGTDESTDGVKEEKDPYAGMDEATKERFVSMEESNKSLQHRIDSDNGRVGALQRKINGLEGDIQTIRSTSTKDQPSTEQITEAMATDENWDKFAEDYPEVAAAIDGRLGKHQEAIDVSLGAQNEQINNTLAPVVQKQVDDDMKEANDAVAEEFPTWQDAVVTQDFNDWISTQSPGVQGLADSDDVQDASSLIGLYDSHLVANGKQSLRKTDHSESDVVVEDQATELEQKRQRQLDDGATIPSKAARIDPTAESEGEFEDAFDAFAKRKDAQRQA